MQALKNVTRRYPEAAAKGLYEEGLEVMAEAQRRTPVDTGRLRASGRTSLPKRSSNPEVVLSFGTDYGIYVHERTELRHVTGEAKFLENAVKAAAPGFLDRLAARIDNYVSGRAGRRGKNGRFKRIDKRLRDKHGRFIKSKFGWGAESSHGGPGGSGGRSSDSAFHTTKIGSKYDPFARDEYGRFLRRKKRR
jgi:hypothetical protein